MTEKLVPPAPAVVLIVEDNPIIAMDAEGIFRGIGSREVHLAASNEEACAMLNDHRFDFALVDVNLGSETSYATAEILMQRDIPFAFTSGDNDPLEGPTNLKSQPVLTKPYSESSVKHLMTEVWTNGKILDTP